MEVLVDDKDENKTINGGERKHYGKGGGRRESERGGKKRYDGERKNYGDKKRFDGKDKNYGGKKQYGSESGRHEFKRDDDLQPEEKKPTAKVMLRLDVKDVVKSGEEPKPYVPPETTDGNEFPKVLYEDNHILVVIKPQNIPSQADSSGDPDFLTELKKYLIEKYDKKGDAYLGLLHRLDRPTGGVMVFAKTSKAAGRLSEQIRAGEFEKSYAAVTSGRPNRTGKVEHYLLKDVQTNTVSVAPSTMEGVKLAASEVTVLDEKDGMSLVAVKLITGRTHQVRVQLKALGAPIVGDYKYAGNKLIKSNNLALWAYRLVFTHPVSGDVMRFVAQPPEEFPWSEFDTDVLIDTVRPITHGHYN